MIIHTIVTNLLLPSLIVFALVVGYVFGLRPMLKQTPAFKQLYANEDTALNAISVKLGGLKQKLATLFFSLAGLVVVAHDSVTSLLAMAGIDPTEYGSQLLPKVPPMVWPFVTLGVLWIIQYFRGLADKKATANALALLDAGQPLAAAAPGIPVDTLPIPSPSPTSPVLFADKKD